MRAADLEIRARGADRAQPVDEHAQALADAEAALDDRLDGAVRYRTFPVWLGDAEGSAPADRHERSLSTALTFTLAGARHESVGRCGRWRKPSCHGSEKTRDERATHKTSPKIVRERWLPLRSGPE